MVVGATVRRDLIDAATPQVIRALDAGQQLGQAMSPRDVDALKLGRKVRKIIEEGGPAAWTLKKLLDLSL